MTDRVRSIPRYSISVAAELAGHAPADALRMYESMGIVSAAAHARRTRRYSDDHVATLRKIDADRRARLNLNGAGPRAGAGADGGQLLAGSTCWNGSSPGGAPAAPGGVGGAPPLPA
jgi:hypothetical protein